MTITLTKEIQSILPPSVRRKAGFRAGDQVEIKDIGGIVTIIPKLPPADDEYTPEQRKIIGARLAKAEQDIKAGHMHGPFESHEAMIEFLHSQRKARRKTSKPQSR